MVHRYVEIVWVGEPPQTIGGIGVNFVSLLLCMTQLQKKVGVKLPCLTLQPSNYSFLNMYKFTQHIYIYIFFIFDEILPSFIQYFPSKTHYCNKSPNGIPTTLLQISSQILKLRCKRIPNFQNTLLQIPKI